MNGFVFMRRIMEGRVGHLRVRAFFDGTFFPGCCINLLCTHSERWVSFALARSALARMLNFVNQQHQNSTNPPVAKVWRFIEKCVAGHDDLIG